MAYERDQNSRMSLLPPLLNSGVIVKRNQYFSIIIFLLDQ